LFRCQSSVFGGSTDGGASKRRAFYGNSGVDLAQKEEVLGSAERIVGPRRLTGGVSVDFEIAAAVRCLMWSYLV
jgi:hypothetical protein